MCSGMLIAGGRLSSLSLKPDWKPGSEMRVAVAKRRSRTLSVRPGRPGKANGWNTPIRLPDDLFNGFVWERRQELPDQRGMCTTWDGSERYDCIIRLRLASTGWRRNPKEL
jgi:hypothetical protein